MLINDTSLLAEETRKKLNATGLIHINNGGKPITEEQALHLIEAFSEENIQKYLKAKGIKY